MGRKGTGTVRVLPNKDGIAQWHARFTRGDGSRTNWIELDPNIPLDDDVKAKQCAAKAAPRVRCATMPEGSDTETFGAYAARWLDDREGRVNSIRDDRSRMRDHVLPELGALEVRTFTRDDVERLRDELDAKIESGALAWNSVASVWTLVTSMCADMVSAKKREFRVRDENPVREVKPPERGSRKAKQFLWPSEFLQFVSSDCVPLAMRRAVAQAIYLFPRDGEHRALEWGTGDVDLEHGVLSITRALNARTGKVESTKSGETRRFAIETNLLPLLHAMHDEAKGKGAVIGWHEPHMSRALRRALQRAGVTRPELHEGSPTRKPLTRHDLRATGLTWMAIRGDDPLKIQTEGRSRRVQYD